MIMDREINWLEKLQSKNESLQSKQMEILNSLKNRDAISYDEVIKKGQELELLREKIWAIEETIHS